MTTLGWMVKLSIELNEYSLEFQPRQSIKAQALADFMAECSFHSSQNLDQGQQPVAKNNGCQKVLKE